METLGRDRTGTLMILTNNLILPEAYTALRLPVSSFTEGHILTMLDNPMGTFGMILVHPSIKDDPFQIGIMCKMSYAKLDGDHVLLHAQGVDRVQIIEYEDSDEVAYATLFKKVPYVKTRVDECHEYEREILKFINKSGDRKLYERVSLIGDHSQLADVVYYAMNMRDKRLIHKFLNTPLISKRLEVLTMAMTEGSEKYSDGLNSKDKEIQELIEKYRAMDLNPKADKEIYSALKSLCGMAKHMSEFPPLFRYVSFALDLPFGKYSVDNDIEHVEKVLDDSHYGMEKAKERLVEYLAIKKLNPNANGMVILLDGPAGTGKTTLAKAFAKALGRECVRISMGGCADATFVKGHSRTYIGSRHGRIIDAINTAQTQNPVIILDEVEKVTIGVQGDPDAALLEVLDPAQNNEFTDNYLGFPFDLSKVIFVATSNERRDISPALYDRMEYMACDGYTMAEKINIASNYTIPRACEDLGVTGVAFPKKLLKHMVENYTCEVGVRTLEKNIKSVLRKVAVDQAKGKKTKVTKKLIESRLGRPFEKMVPMEHSHPGIVTGMYYSSSGFGGCLDIEAIITDTEGSGCLAVTGQAGSVMTESLSLVHSHMSQFQEEYGLDEIDLNKVDLHVHMPEGSVPKDGPSAGAAYALLFASIAGLRKVKAGLAVTGEATLTGRITAIGGVREKCEGAIRLGMTDIVLPKSNHRDYRDLPKYVKEGATFHFVENIRELLDVGLEND